MLNSSNLYGVSGKLYTLEETNYYPMRNNTMPVYAVYYTNLHGTLHVEQFRYLDVACQFASSKAASHRSFDNHSPIYLLTDRTIDLTIWP
jgi:hypothetical protein